MPVYVWKGRSRQGSEKRGEIEAASEQAVMAQLRSQSIRPVRVKQKPKDISEYLPFLQPGVKTRDLVIFTRQFATMIDAGLPLVQCLDILVSQQENPVFKKALRQIKTDVEQGSTFAESLAKHPKIFDNLFVNLVAAGEVGGILDTILNRLATYLEKADIGMAEITKPGVPGWVMNRLSVGHNTKINGPVIEQGASSSARIGLFCCCQLKKSRKFSKSG